MKKKILILWLLLLFVANFTFAQTTVDLLVAYTEDANNYEVKILK